VTDVASQVPSRFDCVISGHGYVFDKSEATLAIFGYTPTFLERSNISGRYGDNEQDFFPTASQNNWAEGEGQRFLRINDPDSASKYWQGSAVNVSVPGQATVQTALDTVINVSVGTSAAISAGVFLDGKLAYTDANSHLWTTTSGGSAADQGAHGAGSVNRWGMACDPNHIYIAGSTAIRSWNGSAFSTFSSTSNAGSLAYLNNILYSCDGAVLRSYDTSGTATTEYPWKDAVGTIVTASSTGIGAKIVPFGGKLLIFRRRGQFGRPELWIFDSNSQAYQIGDFPDSSLGYDMVVINGVVYLSGAVLEMNATGTVTSQPVVWYYLNGTLDELWRSKVATSSSSIGDALVWPALGSYQGRLVFDDNSRSQIMQYDQATGAISSIGTYVTTSASQANDYKFFASDRAYTGLFFTSATKIQLFPSASASIASSGTLTSSLIDFDNSLTKLFRSVKVDWRGSGTVSVSYSLNTLDGTYTGLTSSATSGTEYLFPDNTTGNAVSVKFTLTPSSNTTPILQRYYVRAAPGLQQYRKVVYLLDLSGKTSAGELSNPVRLRDGTDHNLTGAQMLTNLRSLTNASISVTDEGGTFTGVIEWGETEFREVRPSEYIGRISIREV
jgi:hypothetical protein